MPVGVEQDLAVQHSIVLVVFLTLINSIINLKDMKGDMPMKNQQLTNNNVYENLYYSFINTTWAIGCSCAATVLWPIIIYNYETTQYTILSA